MNTQQRIIISLFILAVFLLGANLLVGKIFKTENTIIPPRELSVAEIDSLFFRSIENFGLPAAIVKNKKLKEVQLDSEYPSYSLSLPKDLPIPVFISELNEIFGDYAVDVLTDEKSISGRTIVKIASGNEFRLAADIDYHPGLSREAAIVGFLINIDDKTEKSVIDKLLGTPEPFGFLFTPSLVMKSFIARNQNLNRQFALLLGDETVDLDFKFESGYSERRLKSSFRNLLTAFERASFIVIDDNSSFYRSRIYPFVEKEFLSRRISLIKKSEIYFLSGTAGKPSSQFNELMAMIDSNSSMLLVASPGDFNSILNDIRNFRKIGYKYSVPSEIVSVK